MKHKQQKREISYVEESPIIYVSYTAFKEGKQNSLPFKCLLCTVTSFQIVNFGKGKWE